MNDLTRLYSDHEKNISILNTTTNLKMNQSKNTSLNMSSNPSSFIAPNNNISNTIVDAKKKKTRLVPPSIRLELSIEPPDSKKFTEFNYNKLILKTFKCFKKQCKKDKKINKSSSTIQLTTECVIKKGDLPMLETDVFIRRESIAEFLSVYRKKIILSKELDDDERINGNPGDDINKIDEDNSQTCDLNDDHSNSVAGTSSLSLKKNISRKKSSRNNYESDNNKYKLRDFAYLGKGYDESDSFIDNSDAHDVHVPSNMAPKRGGFYINKEQIKLEKIKDKKGKRSAKLSEDNAEENDGDNINELDAKNGYENENDEDSFESLSSDEESDYDSDEDSDDDDEDEEDDEEEDEESQNEENKLTKLTNSKKRGLDSSSSCSNSLQQITGQNNETNTKKRIRKLIDDDDDDDENNVDNANINNLVSESLLPKKLISNKVDDDEENQNQSINNKENSIIEKLKKPNTSHSTNLPSTINSLNGSPAINNLHFDSNDRKLSKKKKTTHINTTNSLPSSPNISTTNVVSNDLNMTKKKKLNTNSNLNVNNQILNAKTQINNLETNENEKDTGENSSESEECIIIDDVEQKQQQTTSNSIKPITVENINVNIPLNLPSNLVDLTNNLVDTFNKRNLLTQNIWPEDFKLILLRIYTEMQKLAPIEKTQLLNFLTVKLKKPKENLTKICKRMLQKEHSATTTTTTTNNVIQNIKIDSASSNVSQQQNKSNVVTNNKQQTSNTNLLLSPSTTQKPQNVSQNASPSLSKIVFSDLNFELGSHMLILVEKCKIYKQNNKSDLTKFFDNIEIKNIIYQMDRQLRTNNNNSHSINKMRIRDYCMNYLTTALEVNKENFQRKFEQIVSQMHQIKLKEVEANIELKISQLKIEIDAQMEKCLQKYKTQYEQYVLSKNKILNGNESADVNNCPPPRKQFEWTGKLRDMFLHIASLKMSTFRSVNSSPSSRNINDNQQIEAMRNMEREKFIKEFFVEKIVSLWPDNWMQLNILWMKYEAAGRSKMLGQPANRARSSAPPPNNSINNDKKPQIAVNTQINKGVINISSKNGKQIRIESQNVNQTSSSHFVPNNLNKSIQPSKLKMDAINSTANINMSQLNTNQNRMNSSNQAHNKTSPTSTTNIAGNNQQVSPNKQTIHESIVNQQKSKQANVNSPIFSSSSINTSNRPSTNSVANNLNANYMISSNSPTTIQQQQANYQYQSALSHLKGDLNMLQQLNNQHLHPQFNNSSSG